MDTDLNKQREAQQKRDLEFLTMLQVWRAPWQKAALTVAMIEENVGADTVKNYIANQAKTFTVKPSVYFPEAGWIGDLLTKNKPGPVETPLHAMTILNMGDGISKELRLSREGSNEQVESIYREAIRAFTEYVPEGLAGPAREQYISQNKLVVDAIKTTLSAHLLMTGRGLDASSLLSDFVTSRAENKMTGFAALLQQVLQPHNISASNNSALSVSSIAAAETENDENPKHLVRSANDDCLYYRSRTGALQKFRKALEQLGLDPSSREISPGQLDDAARKYVSTPYSVPILGGLFFSADKILSLKDYDLARIYLSLDERVRSIESEPQYGFSKYLIEFMHSQTLAKALMQAGKNQDALNTVTEWAHSAEAYQNPQDMSGRTLGSLLASRAIAQHALLLDLVGRQDESAHWWKRVVARPECRLVICELCADRLELNDITSVAKMLEVLKTHNGTNDKTGDIIFFWWVLSQANDPQSINVFQYVRKQPDFISSFADFVTLEILSKRHNCAASEHLIALIQQEIPGRATEAKQEAEFEFSLLSTYLRQALEYQQMELNEQAEATYEKGLALLESMRSRAISVDPNDILKFGYLESELIKQFAQFLENCNRRDEAILLRSQQQQL